MRAVDGAAQAAREERAGLAERWMLWIASRDRASGVPVSLGLWTGYDSETITVADLFTGGITSRVFHGAGGLLEVSPIRHESGLNIRPVNVRLSGLDPAVLQAFRAYEPRGANVQIWKRSLTPGGLPLGAPEPAFLGVVNRAPMIRPAPGGENMIEAELVSTKRTLTISSALKKSHEAQKRRRIGGVADQIRTYKAAARTIEVPWGQETERGS